MLKTFLSINSSGHYHSKLFNIRTEQPKEFYPVQHSDSSHWSIKSHSAPEQSSQVTKLSLMIMRLSCMLHLSKGLRNLPTISVSNSSFICWGTSNNERELLWVRTFIHLSSSTFFISLFLLKVQGNIWFFLPHLILTTIWWDGFGHGGVFGPRLLKELHGSLWGFELCGCLTGSY